MNGARLRSGKEIEVAVAVHIRAIEARIRWLRGDRAKAKAEQIRAEQIRAEQSQRGLLDRERR